MVTNYGSSLRLTEVLLQYFCQVSIKDWYRLPFFYHRKTGSHCPLTREEVINMRYKLTWLDSTMVAGYHKPVKTLKQTYADRGIKLTITSRDREWVYFDCETVF